MGSRIRRSARCWESRKGPRGHSCTAHGIPCAGCWAGCGPTSGRTGPAGVSLAASALPIGTGYVLGIEGAFPSLGLAAPRGSRHRARRARRVGPAGLFPLELRRPPPRTASRAIHGLRRSSAWSTDGCPRVSCITTRTRQDTSSASARSLLIWIASVIGAAGGYWLARQVRSGTAKRLLGRHGCACPVLKRSSAFLTTLRICGSSRSFRMAVYPGGDQQDAVSGVHRSKRVIGVIPGTFAQPMSATGSWWASAAAAPSVHHRGVIGAGLFVLSYAPTLFTKWRHGCAHPAMR